MKKLSSVLVLMLIALMLFVSCDNNTPAKAKERAATTEDGYLAGTTYTVLSNAKSHIQYDGTSDLENLKLKEGDSNTLEFTGCSLKVQMDKDTFIECVLFGSATQTINKDKNLESLTCNLTEGTKINNEPHKIVASLEITLGEHSEPTNINVKEAIFDDVKITGLTEVLNNLISQSVPPASQPETK